MKSYLRGADRYELSIVETVISIRQFAGNVLVDETTRTCSSIIKAKWDHDRLCRDLVAQGFVRVGGGEEVASLSEHELANTVADHPEDLDTYSVYADWLSERGDPRGELMAVQCALTTLPRFGSTTRRDELSRAETELLFQHSARLWGTLGDTIVDEDTQTYQCDLIEARWHCGFLRDVTIREASPSLLSNLIDTLAGLEIAKLLRTMTLASIEWPVGTIESLARHRWPKLVTLELECEGSFDANRVVPLVTDDVAPTLTELRVTGTRSTDALCRALATSPLGSRIEEISLWRGEFTNAGIDALAAARFAALSMLRLSGTGPARARGALAGLARRVIVDLNDENQR